MGELHLNHMELLSVLTPKQRADLVQQYRRRYDTNQ